MHKIDRGRSNGWQWRTYDPVTRLGEALGERVDAVGDVGERAGGGRGGEDRCSDSRPGDQLVKFSLERSIAGEEKRGRRQVVSPATWRSLGGCSTWVVALTTATSRSLRSRPPPLFTLAIPTVAESLMAPHAFRHRFCTDTEPIGGGGGGRAGRLPRLARFSPCRCLTAHARAKSSPSPRVVARAWPDPYLNSNYELRNGATCAAVRSTMHPNLNQTDQTTGSLPAGDRPRLEDAIFLTCSSLVAAAARQAPNGHLLTLICQPSAASGHEKHFFGSLAINPRRSTKLNKKVASQDS